MNPALLIIDLQNDYFQGGKMELVGTNSAAENAKRLLNYFREKKLSIFHVQHISLKPSATFFLPNTSGVEINCMVQPEKDETIILKNYPNSFRNTSLEIDLKRREITDLVICGAMSHMCIDATTRSAFDLGFNCTVIHDACATRDLVFQNEIIHAAKVHASFMSALGSAYANIESTLDYIGRNDHR